MPDIAPLSDAKRRLLDRYFREGAVATAPPVSASMRKPPDEPAPVSLSQEQLLLRERRAQGGPPLYNECITLHMKGPLEIAVLKRSLSEIIRRHEIWRTGYDTRNGQLIQVVRPFSGNLDLPVIDLRGLPKSDCSAEIQQVTGYAVRQPFDLKEGPLLRARIFRTADSEHFLLLSAHLSIVDGVSVYQVFPSELAALYRAYFSGGPCPLPDLAVQFADYAYWQRRWLHGEEFTQQLAYWRKQLAGQVPVLKWPAHRVRPAKETFRGAIQPFSLPKELVEAVRTLSRREGVTLFMSLLAAFVSLLHCYTQQEDIIVGTPSPAGRKRSETQKLLGYFLNPVALRFDLTANPTFQKLLQQARQLTLEALSNDDVPLELLAQELRAAPDPSRNPFFTVAISLQPPMPQLELEWSVTSMDIESGGSPWDFYLAFIDQPAGTVARVQYNPDLFEAQTVAKIMEDYEALLEALSRNPLKRLSEVKLMHTAAKSL